MISILPATGILVGVSALLSLVACGLTILGGNDATPSVLILVPGHFSYFWTFVLSPLVETSFFTVRLQQRYGL